MNKGSIYLGLMITAVVVTIVLIAAGISYNAGVRRGFGGAEDIINGMSFEQRCEAVMDGQVSRERHFKFDDVVIVSCSRVFKEAKI